MSFGLRIMGLGIGVQGCEDLEGRGTVFVIVHLDKDAIALPSISSPKVRNPQL